MTIPLADQIAELRREYALRRNVYPAFVARSRMTQEEADQHQARLDAAIKTLRWLETHADKVRAAAGEPIPEATG